MVRPRLGMINKVQRIALMIVLHLLAVICLLDQQKRLYLAPSTADGPLGGIHAKLLKRSLVWSAAGSRPRDPGPGACAGRLVGFHLSFVKGQPVCRAAAVLCKSSQR